MQATTNSSYDDVIYVGHPYPESHLDRLSTIGKLFSMKPVPITNCRVLELGCGTGDNIIPMASNLPNSQFVGIDLSSRQVEMGNEVISGIDLKNIEIKNISVMDIDDSWGEFDYIIAHGLYSWVTDEVQEKILSICSENLTADGIAYISCNTYPGWHIRENIRQMMLFHTAQFSEPEKKIEQARAVIGFLANSTVTEKNSHDGMMLKKELEKIRKAHDSYLFHEFLEDANNPLYFHQFIKKASGYGLQYLGETDFRSMLPSVFPKKTAETLNRISFDIVSTEQYMDFLRNRSYRSTLLCHKDQKIDHDVKSSDFDGMLVSLSTSQVRPMDFSAGTDFPIVGDKGRELKVSSPMVKATIAALCDHWPRYIGTGVLFKEAVKILNDSGVHPDATDTDPIFMDALFWGYSSKVYEFHTWQADMVTRVSDRPRVNKLAAYQAIKGKPVVNQHHRYARLDNFDQQLLRIINDTEDMDSLHSRMFDLTKNGTITLQKDDESVTDTEKIFEIVQAATNRAMSKLANAALLIE